MLTIRGIERFWNSKETAALLRELIGMRIEKGVAGDLAGRAPAAAAALSLIRIDEWQKNASPLCGTLIRAVLSAQEADGGWGDVLVTALCVRALSLSNGAGHSIERGLAYLANLQQPAGSWPRVPLRRMSADETTTAFVLMQLADLPIFWERIQAEEAFDYLAGCDLTHEPDAALFYNAARLRRPPAHVLHNLERVALFS